MHEILSRPAHILLVEDDPADAELFFEAFESARFRDSFVHVEDGVKALEYLRGSSADPGRRKPSLIVLDLNLPRKDGRQVLLELKADHELKRIPVVILTTSNLRADIDRCYEAGANCYVTKPTGLEEFMSAVKEIETFWLRVAELPEAPPEPRRN